MIELSPAEFSAIRAGIGYTRAELAALVGVKPQSVHNWEAGKTGNPPGPGYRAASAELARLFAEWRADVAELRGRVRAAGDDMPPLAYPRLSPDGHRPDGWWRSVAFQVLMDDPEQMLEWSDGDA